MKAMLRNIPADLQLEVGFDPGSGVANYTIQGAVFHGVADHIEYLETEVMRLKARLFDVIEDECRDPVQTGLNHGE